MKPKRAQAKAFRHSHRSERKQHGPIRPAASLPIINRHAGGIDVGATEHWVCLPEDSVPQGQANVRSFGAFSAQLDQLVEWLLACAIQTVALESTGVYWIPLVQKLEAAGIEVVLVNARHLKYVPGRKSDVRDCQWLQQLHSYGLLNGSFRPTQDICELRSYLRHRHNLIEGAGREVQHMQKALQQMNVHLHHAVSDLVGATGLRILDAVLAGERDPKVLVELRDDALCTKSTKAELEKALAGDWREEHLFALRQALETHRHLLKQVTECDEQIKKIITQLEPPEQVAPEVIPPNPKAVDPGQAKRKKKRFHRNKTGASFKLDLTQELKRLCGVDLTQILGLSVLSVLTIISEIGLDMSRWRNAKAFCAWLGLCPRNKISGGKVLDSRTAHVVNRVSILLKILAPSIGKTDTWLGVFHRRMRARLGPAGANTATARKVACLIYHLLRYREDYIIVDHLVFTEKIRDQRIKRLRKQAAELGMQLTEVKQAA
jgi:transposase